MGAASGESAHRQVDARVVRGEPCAGAGRMEIIRYTMDGRERLGRLDGCGHEADETLQVTVGTDEEVATGHLAEAAAGQGRYGQRLGEVMLVLAAIAGAGYGLLLRRTSPPPSPPPSPPLRN
ncbi:MAG TPA: hypothetical protein VFV67_10805 [Actinophytocola sp.]|uniref:hypothetical protein n=1 Tax=Actinophytocola sp. TaxID=1872138 RepID=UPI002DB84127|nr:hypothetical protein [Actinophytocola sp.]HEU5471133.1 hypothetical protein [Actinophytocola sp.]